MQDFDIYPLTITKDRYMGTYSGGEWTAWNCDADEVPEEIACDDVTCCEFWSLARDAKPGKMGIYYILNCDDQDETPIPMFGVGSTPEAAVEDLKRRMDRVGI
jgi:hypothetical protein